MNIRRDCLFYAAFLTKRYTKAHPSSSIATLPTQGMEESTLMDIEAKQNALGGGAINEKPRVYNTNNDPIVNGKDRDISSNSWNPSDELSHMLHALVGLDRYPNYLSRFQHFSDINSLEKALEARLSDVRRQKSEIAERRADIRQLVRGYILSESEGDLGKDSYNCSELWCDHPLLSTPKTWTELREKKVLTDQAFKVCYRSIDSTSNARKAKSKKRTNSLPTLEDIIHGKVQVHLDPSLLEEWMNQEMYDVYSFSLLTNEFCCLLRKTVRELSILAESDEFSHLQFGRRPIDLDTIGLGWVADLLFHMFIQPLSLHLFARTEKLVDDDVDLGPSTLDWRQGYVAGYSSDPKEYEGTQRHRLVPHTDDSEVTLNCCLGDEFKGGSVEFYGLRGTPREGHFVGKIDRPNVGTAILHSGRNLHAVSNVSSGDRYALIVWSRSWSHTRLNTCPCCWLNRRQDSTCICNRRWN